MRKKNEIWDRIFPYIFFIFNFLLNVKGCLQKDKGQTTFFNVHGGIEVINLHEPVLPTEISIHNSKKLFVRQRFKTLSSLYRRSSCVYVFRQELNEDTFA